MDIENLYSIFLESKQISIDSRNIIEGDIFFALKGGILDGSIYAEEAIKKGAKIAIVSDKKYINNKNIFYNLDPLNLLQELAKKHRNSLSIPFISITGTNGKTTTKEMIFSVLSKKYKTFKTKGNLNNHIGVPLSILSIDKEEIAVIEMGASKKGDIEELCNIAKPNYGYITSFGKAHLQEFISFENIVETKVELYNYLKKNKGVVFLNNDDSIQISKSEDIEKYSFGKNNSNVKSEFIEAKPFVKVRLDGKEIQTKMIGDYNYTNLVSSYTIGKYFGVKEKDIIEVLINYQTDNNRTQLIEKENYNILMDCYNANPTSMILAINNFHKNILSEKKILILGDMLELGNKSHEEHKYIFENIRQMNFYKVYFVGEEFYKLFQKIEGINFYKNYEDFSKEFKIEKKAYYLVKGSRGIRLERIYELVNE